MSYNRTNVFIITVAIIILFNEFTLALFDPNPPLDKRVVGIIRFFNGFIILVGLSWSYIPFRFIGKLIKGASDFLTNFILPSVLTVIFLDIGLSFLGFGYPSHYDEENIQRYPSPGDSFAGKPKANEHNQYGFRGSFANNGKIRIALFGGSTGYNGDPPIIEIAADELNKKGYDVSTLNFSSVSSNHTQHIHRMLKFYDKFSFDIVIFYGGGNETLQYLVYDPRVGYPYNFFFRNELDPGIQTLLKYSSIFGEVDKRTGIFSGISKLKKQYIDEVWWNEVIENYWRDLKVAEEITKSLVVPNFCSEPQFVSVTQPGNPKTIQEKRLWLMLKESQTQLVNVSHKNHFDFTILEEEVEFTDTIHLVQESRHIVGKKLSEELEALLMKKCN